MERSAKALGVTFRDLPLKRKLTLIVTLTSTVSLILACAAFLTYELVMFRRTMVRDLATLAEIIGQNSTAALVFRDRRSGDETLAALRAEPQIKAAYIYGENGEVFASYLRSATEKVPAPSGPWPDGHRFGWDRLELYRPIVLDSERIGEIYLEADLRQMYARLGLYAGIVGLVLLASSLVALSLSAKLQSVISEPILHLARVARVVSAEKNYTVRAVKQSKDELGFLVDSFNGMLTQIQQRTAQLEAANKELEAFSYSVSHDLRTPLRTIDGFSKVLLLSYSDKLDTQGQHYLSRVRAGTQRMEQLIEDLLNLSRITREEMCRQKVDLGPMAWAIAADLKKTQPERKVTFAIASGLEVEGDPRLVRIVLENLLGNAWKFTGKRSDATIELGVADIHGQTTYFVRDDGAGFDPAYAGQLFGPFQRLHSRTEFEGTGIGLATAQRIIYRHGGRIWAESEVGKGATFYFTL